MRIEGFPARDVEKIISDMGQNSWQDYQGKTQITAQDVDMRHRASYSVLGLAEEAGEVAGVHAKMIRDRGGAMTPMDRDNMKKELGDCLWHLSQVGLHYDLTLEEIAQANIDKLMDRYARGVINGNGDNR